MKRLRIGEITYANLFPIFYRLRKSAASAGYEFVQAPPSALNRMIREGGIDVSPSSSIEYLRNADRYRLIENHSISATGRIRSIVLFSRRPIGELEDRTVLTTSQSETSVALLKIVLRKFYGLSCRYESFSSGLADALGREEAYLSIGDEALIAHGSGQGGEFRYDLGEIWYERTGLPFTYALWILRKECCADDPLLLVELTDALDQAKVSALADLEAVAAASPLREVMPASDLVAYWRGIDYDFTETHKRGFDLFGDYCRELGLL